MMALLSSSSSFSAALRAPFSPSAAKKIPASPSLTHPLCLHCKTSKLPFSPLSTKPRRHKLLPIRAEEEKKNGPDSLQKDEKKAEGVWGSLFKTLDELKLTNHVHVRPEGLSLAGASRDIPLQLLPAKLEDSSDLSASEGEALVFASITYEGTNNVLNKYQAWKKSTSNIPGLLMIFLNRNLPNLPEIEKLPIDKEHVITVNKLDELDKKIRKAYELASGRPSGRPPSQVILALGNEIPA